MKYIGIDPSTKTGFVVLDKDNNVIVEKEIMGDGSEDPKRMVTALNNIMSEVKRFDKYIVFIEGFSYQSRGKSIDFQFGLGHAIRNAMYVENIEYVLIAPSQLKKYATNKGNSSKENMILPIYKTWGYEHESDNVRDAYVLAQIARAFNGCATDLHKYQESIIKDIKKKG